MQPALATAPRPSDQRLAADAPFRRALVVANPIAGRGRGEAAARELAEALASLGIAADLHLTRGRGDGAERVRAADTETDLCFAVGGDGTLSEVLEGVGQRNTAVGLLPLGTENLLAVQFRLPRAIPKVLEMVAGARTTLVDTARVNGSLCFLCAGVGIDGWVVKELEHRRRGAITKWAYVRALAQVLPRYRAPELELTIDGKTVDGRFGFVLVSNLSLYGAFFRLAQSSRADDGLFEVYAIPRADVAGLLALGARGFFSRLPGGRGRLWQARHVTVKSPTPVSFQVDGDYRGETPLALSLAPERHRILIP